MKIIYLITLLTLLFSCGRKADKITVESQLAPVAGRFNLDTDKEVDPVVREMVMFSFPLENELGNFSYTDGDHLFNRDLWTKVFNTLPFGNRYIEGISRSLPTNLKSQKTVASIFAIGLSRDNAWREYTRFNTLKDNLLAKLNAEFFSKYPCYQIKKGNNRRKCLVKEKRRVTKDSASFAKSCADFKERLEDFLNLKEDENLPGDERAQYILSDSEKVNYEAAITSCEDMDKNQMEEYTNLANEQRVIRNDGKTLVRDLLSKAELDSGFKYLATGATKHDPDTAYGNESVLDIDLKTMTIRNIELAIDFQVGGDEPYPRYSPELGNMSTPIISTLYNASTGETYYILNFKIYTSKFTMETDGGLSIGTNSSFGVRMSGKTLWRYNNGIVRKGIMKIELDLKN